MNEISSDLTQNENITFNNKLINAVIANCNEENRANLEGLIEPLHPADLADLLTFLNTDQRSYILGTLKEDRYTEVLAELDDTIIDETVQNLEEKKVVRSISEMETDDAINLIDPSNKPLGSASVSKVLRSQRDTKLSNILEDSPKFVKASMDQEEVALFFEQYSLVSAGVVDDQNRLIGRITADDIVWVLQEEAEEDILRLGGVAESEMNQSIGRSTKRRFIWLFINLLTAILASYVISLFDASIEKMVALAVLMPIVASMGGNAGTQTLTLTVRSLATKELVENNRRKVFIKEIGISILNGFIFAILTGVAALIWFEDLSLSIIVGAAMIINILSAGFFGFLIPYVFNRIKIDPALASSVFVTTITDVFGFLSFLGLASIYLF